MARLTTKQATYFACPNGATVELSPNRSAYIDDAVIEALLEEDSPRGTHARDYIDAGIVEVRLDGDQASDRERRIRHLVDETLRVQELATGLEEDELAEARRMLDAKARALPRVARTSEPTELGDAPAEDGAAAAVEAALGDPASPSTSDPSSGDPSPDTTGGLDGLPPTLVEHTIETATPLVESTEDADLLQLWRDTDERKGIHQLIDARLEALTAPGGEGANGG